MKDIILNMEVSCMNIDWAFSLEYSFCIRSVLAESTNVAFNQSISLVDVIP